jgi:error-prone DNA polymerase
MLTDSRRKRHAHSGKRVNAPEPVVVRVDSRGLPVEISGAKNSGHNRVARVSDLWRVNQRWWRGNDHEIVRHYYELVSESGRRFVVFNDLIRDQWFRQEEWNHQTQSWDEPPPTPSALSGVARYAELHLHSEYSFRDSGSTMHDLLEEAKRLGIEAVAITDHNNLCGAMFFSQAAHAVGIKPVIGVELTLLDGHHLTLLAETMDGYRNISRLVTLAHIEAKERLDPRLDPKHLRSHAEGVICLSGCRKGELSEKVLAGDLEAAIETAATYRDWFGADNYFIELQQNLVKGDRLRNMRLARIAREVGVGIVATGNIHYHSQERHHLHDVLTAVRHNKSVEETYQERLPNDQYFLRSPSQMAQAFNSEIHGAYAEAIANTVHIADRCNVDLNSSAIYSFPTYTDLPQGHTESSYLRDLCEQAAVRKYGAVTTQVRERLDSEFHLIERHNLAGFLLQYYDIIKIAREVQEELGLIEPGIPIEDQPPGRGRGSSVALLIGYLIGLSHIDPLQFDLKLERFLPDDEIAGPPDIDLDFPREIREKLILRVHERWGYEHAALTGAFHTYKVRGAIRDIGKALALPQEDVDSLAKSMDGHAGFDELAQELRNRIDAPLWEDLARLARQLIGFPRQLAQHPGGMILSARPLSESVPIQPAAMDGRFICQWDKNAADDAGFVKIDFLALGALSQMAEAVDLIRVRHEEHIDLSRIDFNDKATYDSIHDGDTIGTFQIESAAQRQTVIRLKPKNLVEMAWEVAAVRPGVGVNDGVTAFIHRHNGEPWDFDHPLEREALKRTYGVPIYQDQLEELARYVAGMRPSEAASMRKAFTRQDASRQVPMWRQRFIEGALAKGVPPETAQKIAGKFHGFYQFPESHAYAFGITAYQMQWLKVHYPLEFLIGLFNQQPMGFYNLETLKEDGRRHGVTVLNPDANRSGVMATIDSESLRPGFAHVAGISKDTAELAVAARDHFGPFHSLSDFMRRTGLRQKQLDNLVHAGALDNFDHHKDTDPNRRNIRWEVGLRDEPINEQFQLPIPVGQNMIRLPEEGDWTKMMREYESLGFFPKGHVMEKIRNLLPSDICSTKDIEYLEEGAQVKIAGLKFRLQHPNSNVYFMGLEDEFGHAELIMWPRVYQQTKRYLHGSNLLIASGNISRREGTLSIVVVDIEPIEVIAPQLQTKDWG